MCVWNYFYLTISGIWFSHGHYLIIDLASNSPIWYSDQRYGDLKPNLLSLTPDYPNYLSAWAEANYLNLLYLPSLNIIYIYVYIYVCVYIIIYI